MISVLADGESCYRLHDPTGGDVGWIRGRTIGFHGRWTEAQAIAAAAAGWPTFQGMLQREFAGWPTQTVALDALRVVHDGAYEWVSDGRVPVARLGRASTSPATFEFVRHADDVDADAIAADRLAIQFVLPTFASEGVAVSIAQVLGNTLAAHLADDVELVAPRAARRAPSVMAAERSVDVAASA